MAPFDELTESQWILRLQKIDVQDLDVGIKVDSTGVGSAVVLDLELAQEVGSAAKVRIRRKDQLPSIDVGGTDELACFDRDAVIGQSSRVRQQVDLHRLQRIRRIVVRIGEPEISG